MPSVAARLGAAVLAAAPLAVLFLAAPVAEAHDVLISTSPADGATVIEGPEAVELTFSNSVQSRFAQVAVLDQDENAYQDGEPTVVGPTVAQPIRSLPAGEFTVSYRVVSSDGHPVSGTFTFTVAASEDASADPPTATATSAPPTASGEPAASGAPAASEDEADGRPGTGTIVAMIAGAATAGAVIALLVYRRRTEVEETDS